MWAIYRAGWFFVSVFIIDHKSLLEEKCWNQCWVVWVSSMLLWSAVMISWLPVICCTPIIAIKARMTRIFSCCISQHKRLVNYCQLFHPHLLHLLLLISILLLLIVHPFNICRGINSRSSVVNTSFNPFRYFFYQFFFFHFLIWLFIPAKNLI